MESPLTFLIFRNSQRDINFQRLPKLFSPRVTHRLLMGIHLPVEGWADAQNGQSSEINILLTIAKS